MQKKRFPTCSLFELGISQVTKRMKKTRAAGATCNSSYLLVSHFVVVIFDTYFSRNNTNTLRKSIKSVFEVFHCWSLVV